MPASSELDCHKLTTLDCLLWADVEVVCPTESADLIKTGEKHIIFFFFFIWFFLLSGLTLIRWLLPALWLWRGVEGGEALCLMLTDSKQNTPSPATFPCLLHLTLPAGLSAVRSLRESSCLLRFAALLWISTSQNICPRPVVNTVHARSLWTTCGRMKPRTLSFTCKNREHKYTCACWNNYPRRGGPLIFS